ncbi:unnamed protein product [Orchesella dallaii]|uniref:Uncharacterized protein n=1 Tax=Orchesella dallaii TaxID=48710 RepID=A0ABP1R5P9_9HEXA
MPFDSRHKYSNSTQTSRVHFQHGVPSAPFDFFENELIVASLHTRSEANNRDVVYQALKEDFCIFMRQQRSFWLNIKQKELRFNELSSFDVDLIEKDEDRIEEHRDFHIISNQLACNILEDQGSYSNDDKSFVNEERDPCIELQQYVCSPSFPIMSFDLNVPSVIVSISDTYSTGSLHDDDQSLTHLGVDKRPTVQKHITHVDSHKNDKSKFLNTDLNLQGTTGVQEYSEQCKPQSLTGDFPNLSLHIKPIIEYISTQRISIGNFRSWSKPPRYNDLKKRRFVFNVPRQKTRNTASVHNAHKTHNSCSLIRLHEHGSVVSGNRFGTRNNFSGFTGSQVPPGLNNQSNLRYNHYIKPEITYTERHRLKTLDIPKFIQRTQVQTPFEFLVGLQCIEAVCF